jgi:hypothetical protein
MEQWSDEVELYPETQRFGNRAFRKYIAIVEEVRLTPHIRPILTVYTATPHSSTNTTRSHNPNPSSPPPIPRIRTPRSPRLRIRPRAELCARLVYDGADGIRWYRRGRREGGG